VKFVDGVRLEEIELKLDKCFRRQRFDLLLDLVRQRAELGFHEAAGRPPLTTFDAAFDATFVSGLHEGFDLLESLGLQKRLQSLVLGLIQLGVGLQAFGQEETLPGLQSFR
jgi:hypothetical protein